MIMKIYGRVQRRRVRMEELAFRVGAIGPQLQDRLMVLYAPPAPADSPRAEALAELIDHFLKAVSAMTLAEAASSSGVTIDTIRRLRDGQKTVQDRTKQRIERYLGIDQP